MKNERYFVIYGFLRNNDYVIMGNFKKENLTSSELNCFCFYIRVGYFFYTI